MQVPERHFVPAEHCASTWQVEGQVEALPVQTYGEQAGLPGSPAGALLQVPPEPGRSQASQAPVQSESQHTPSAQLPLRHEPATEQVAPGTFLGKHEVPSQYWPVAH